jgi:hypothetical protein
VLQKPAPQDMIVGIKWVQHTFDEAFAKAWNEGAGDGMALSVMAFQSLAVYLLEQPIVA